MQIKGCESSSLAIFLGKVDMTSLFCSFEHYAESYFAMLVPYRPNIFWQITSLYITSVNWKTQLVKVNMFTIVE